MRRRAFLILSGGAALGACTPVITYPPPPRYIVPAPQTAPGVLPTVPIPPARPVGMLLPLSGRLSDIGQAMLRAAQLALAAPGMPALLPADTFGTAAGAQTGLQSLLGRGAGLILGPLTAPETDIVAQGASAAGVPVLAFTNTVSAARPGVWTLGITPAQQVDRLVAYARSQGRMRFAALLADDGFGQALARALSQALAARGLPPARIEVYGPEGPAAALSQLVPAGAPPAFDVLLLGATGGPLNAITAALPGAGIRFPSVQIIGPALWAAPASGAGQLVGAWYAAPNPAARAPFARAYVSRYGAQPPGPADIAYDAASIARVLAPENYSESALTDPAGFYGADGWLRLLPDGRAQRGLAVFQTRPNGGDLISPAPADAAAYAA